MGLHNKKRASSSNDTTTKHPYMTQNFWVKKLEREGYKMPVSTVERILAIIDGFKFQPELYRKP